MTQDQYHPIPGEMDSIDSLRKERDELKCKLEVAVEALENIRIHQQFVVADNKPYAYRLSTTWHIAITALEKIGEGK